MLRQALLSAPAHLSREAAMFAAGTAARGTTQPAAGEDNPPGGEACGKNGDANFRVGPDLGLAVGLGGELISGFFLLPCIRVRGEG